MIEAVQNMIDELKDFDRLRDQILLDLAKDRERQIIQMNITQLQSGQSGEGSEIVPSYRPSTIERKKRRGQPYNKVTLEDEGDFHASFFVRYGDDFFELDSDDQKRVYLERKYGQKIYGLTDENTSRLIASIREEFIGEFRRKLLA